MKRKFLNHVIQIESNVNVRNATSKWWSADDVCVRYIYRTPSDMPKGWQCALCSCFDGFFEDINDHLVSSEHVDNIRGLLDEKKELKQIQVRHVVTTSLQKRIEGFIFASSRVQAKASLFDFLTADTGSNDVEGDRKLQIVCRTFTRLENNEVNAILCKMFGPRACRKMLKFAPREHPAELQYKLRYNSYYTNPRTFSG